MEDSYFRCDECNLNFPNIYLLERHQKKFCSINNLDKSGVVQEIPQQSINEQFKTTLKDELRRQAKQLEVQRAGLVKQLKEISASEDDQDILFSISDNFLEKRKIKNGRTSITRLPEFHGPLSDSVQADTKNRLLLEARHMYEDYIQNGGNDKDIFRYFKQLFDEILNLGKSYNNKIVFQDENSPLPLPSHLLHHQHRLQELRNETEYYRQQLELEQLRQELHTLRGHSNKPVLPPIGEDSLPQKYVLPQVVQRENPLLLQAAQKQQDVFQMAPYDPASGFTIFWDFIRLSEKSSGYCQLNVTLYLCDEEMSETSTLPMVPYGKNHTAFDWNNSKKHQPGLALLGVKQKFPKSFPNQSNCLIVHLQITEDDGSRISTESLVDYGWSKIQLFDVYNRIICGKWKVPLRILPIHQDLTMAEMNTIAQLGQSEVFFRLVNSRDEVTQEKSIVDQNMMFDYKYPPIQHETLYRNRPHPTSHQAALPPPIINNKPPQNIFRKNSSKKKTSTAVPVIPQSKHSPILNERQLDSKAETLKLETPNEEEIEDEIMTNPEINLPSLDANIGIQLDKIIDLDYDGEIKVVLSILNPDGQVAFCNDGGAMFTSSSVKPTFLYRTNLFDLQKKYFSSVQLFKWSTLILQIFKSEHQFGSTKGSSIMSIHNERDERLVAWGCFVLFTPDDVQTSSTSHDILKEEKIRFGYFHLQLYKPPMATFKSILQKVKTSRTTAFNASEANISFNLYIDEKNKLSFSNELSIVPFKKDIPQDAWIEYKRQPLNKLFKNGDGFDFYIDAARFLPDSTVCSKIVVGLFEGQQQSSNKSPFTRTMRAISSPQTQAQEPVFDSKFEFRDFAYDSQSKLVITVYILCSVTKRVGIYGYAILPLFVAPNTFEAPLPSKLEYCLNEGCIQLKLYRYLDDHATFKEDQLFGPLPCSSLLVRLLPAACYADGQCKTQQEIPEDEWINEGLYVTMPSYQDRCYHSVSCLPLDYEIELFHYFVSRKTESVERKAHIIISDGKKPKSTQDWLTAQFKMEEDCPNFSLNFFTKYSSLHGLFIRLERSQNLSWNGLTFATFCLSPPASFYEGSTADSIILVKNIHEDSLVRHVTWLDDLKIFPRRNYSPNLLVIVQLYELAGKPDNLRFNPQAWTLLPLTASGFPLHGYFQIPLFHGLPNQTILKEIAQNPLVTTIGNFRKKKMLKVMDSSSVFLRVGDARRIDDGIILESKIADKSFLPKSNKYFNIQKSKPIQNCVPSTSTFQHYLGEGQIQFERFIFGQLEAQKKLT